MVSVIITTHNRIQLLKNAIESVQKQTYVDFECIVVNDASDDGTEQYLETLNDERFHVISISKAESKGGNYARNLGIKNTSGEYIAFLDDDDRWKPQKLALQSRYLDEHPDIGLVYCQIYKEYPKEKYMKRIDPSPWQRGDMSKKIFICMPCISSMIMLRRDVLYRAGLFDEKLKFWQDYDLCIRMCQLTKIDYVKKYLVIINDDHTDKQRLTNKFYEWIEAVKYENHKYKKEISLLSDKMKQKRKLLIYEDAATRCKSSGNIRGNRYYLRLIKKMTKKEKANTYRI